MKNMKLVIGLGILGAVLLIFSIVWITEIEPDLEKLPSDLDEIWQIDAAVSLEASGTKMDLEVERTQKAIDVQGGVLIIEEKVTSKPLPLLNDVITWGIDRSSRKLVPGYAENPDSSALWAYPIGTKKKDYEVWSTVAGSAPYARFTTEEKIDGLKVYVFVTDEKDLPFDPDDMGVTSFIPQDITGPYTQNIYYIEKVEPYTGIVIDAELTRQFFGINEAGEKTLVGSLVQTYSDETVDEKISDGKHYKTQLLWATKYGLWIGITLSVVLPLFGGWLAFRARRLTETV